MNEVAVLYFSFGISVVFSVLVWICKFSKNHRLLRYQSEQGRIHAICGCLLSVLFFLPMLRRSIDPVYLVIIAIVYTFGIVPPVAGLVKTELLNRALSAMDPLCVRRILYRRIVFIINLSIQCLIHLPDIYKEFKTLHNLSCQIIFFYLCEKIFEDKKESSEGSGFSMYVLYFYTILEYLRKSLKERPWSVLTYEANLINIAKSAWSVTYAKVAKSIVLGAILLGFSAEFNAFRPGWTFLGISFTYFILTETNFDDQDHFFIRKIKEMRIEHLQELEFMWIPLVMEAIPVITSTVAIAVCMVSKCGVGIMTLMLCSFFNVRCSAMRLYKLRWLPLKTELEALNLFRIPEKGEFDIGDNCPICFDSMTVASRITPCHHVFHSFCLRKCLAINGHCPVCRQSLTNTVKQQ